MGKIAYKVQNWKQYNRALIDRGNLTLWFSEDAIQSWYSHDKQDGRGRRFTYSDACIELALTLRSLFRFPLRATQGFLEGLVKLMDLNCRFLTIPVFLGGPTAFQLYFPEKRNRNHLIWLSTHLGSKFTVRENGKCELTVSKKEEPGENIT